VIGVGASIGVTIRWDGDWDQEHEQKGNGFDDLMHFEIVQ